MIRRRSFFVAPSLAAVGSLAATTSLAALIGLGITAATVPAAAQVPTPADVLGFEPGEDYQLAPYAPIASYFEQLAASTDRMVLEQIGESTRGEPLYLAAISTPENLRNMERFKEITRTLAYARDPAVGHGSVLPEDEARRLAREGKVIVWIDGGLHATEVAHGQVMPEMAHYFVTDDSDETRFIRENAILLLMANMNPDGLNIVADWYMSNVGGPFEMASVPELYHHYVGHDNNRDWYMTTQVETQAVTHQLYHEWFPQIVYNQHQSSPWPGRIWMPPFADPVNPNLDPLLVSSLNHMGQSMRKRFDVEGKTGVNSGITFDLWWNGSMRGGPDYHNMLGFLTETAGAGYATPRCYGDDEIPTTFGARNLNMPTRSRSTNYNNPWLGGCWHLRDAMDYMMTAAIGVADTGAKLREDYLFNHYLMGRRQIERGGAADGGPFAYVLEPRASHNPSAVVEFMELMQRSGIEFVRSTGRFEAGGRAFAPGSYVIPPQAFRPYVVDLMEPKEFPDRRQYPGGPPIPPYDMTGYELRFQMGLEVVNVDEPFDMPFGVWNEVDTNVGRVRGTDGTGYLVRPNSNWLYRGLADRIRGGRVFRTTQAIDGVAAGAYWMPDLESNEARRLAADFALTTARPEGDVSAAAPVEVRMPRVAIYRSWQARMPEGWTRWVLDQYGFAWENVWDGDVREGALSDYDVLIVPSQSVTGIRDGHASGDMPAEYVGGLGEAGVAAVDAFVRNGGRLVAVDQSVDFALELFDLPFRNAVAGVSTQEFFLPGSIIQLRVDDSHPLGWGLAPDAVTLFARSQVLERTDAGRAPGVSTPVCY
ncbi:MAG: peptidase M14, partial [Gemmatimonadetes bacterium]|nr:peptidase M14 [Gemmatimonadota bacterium]